MAVEFKHLKLMQEKGIHIEDAKKFSKDIQLKLKGFALIKGKLDKNPDDENTELRAEKLSDEIYDMFVDHLKNTPPPPAPKAQPTEKEIEEKLRLKLEAETAAKLKKEKDEADRIALENKGKEDEATRIEAERLANEAKLKAEADAAEAERLRIEEENRPDAFKTLFGGL